MSAGAVTLADYPAESVDLDCLKCERRGRYRKQSLVAIHGGAIGLSDRRTRLAADCPRARHATGNDLCSVQYTNLVADSTHC